MKHCLLIAFLFITALATHATYSVMHQHPIPQHPDPSQAREMLLVPTPNLARLISLGYHHAAADLLWFKTTAYFGSHIKGDHNIHRLDSLCSSILALNPKARHVSLFCAQMLAWELKRPREAIVYLSTAIDNHPGDWFLSYLRGLFYLYFLSDTKAAQNDLTTAAAHPESFPLVKRLAAKNLATISGPKSGIAFLDLLLSTEKNAETRAALERRRDELVSQLIPEREVEAP
jgi:hypothetical protein